MITREHVIAEIRRTATANGVRVFRCWKALASAGEMRTVEPAQTKVSGAAG
jgi:hypothetical protein